MADGCLTCRRTAGSDKPANRGAAQTWRELLRVSIKVFKQYAWPAARK